MYRHHSAANTDGILGTRQKGRIEQGWSPSPASRKYRLGGADFRVRGYPSLPGRSLNNLFKLHPEG